MITLEDTNVNEMTSSGCSVVMFTAEFSGPCTIASEMFDFVASRKGNQLAFYRFDLDGNTKFPKTIGLKAVPLFAFFRDGELLQTLVGAVEEEVLTEKLEEIFDD